MFRNPVGEFHLSSGRASRRSFRPECEALEQRIVPDATESLAPSSHAPMVDPRLIAAVELFTSQLELLQARIEHRFERANQLEREGNLFGSDNAANAAERLARNAEKVALRVFDPAVKRLANIDSLMDPNFQQAFNQFKDALVNLENTVQHHAHFAGLSLP
jgi:hypothetical protein